MSKQNVYDNAAFFDNFQSSRSNTVSFNDCIETPILFGMLPDLHGKKVLDIGCGMGQHAKQYADMGAASVLGIDLSEKMLEYAKEHNSSTNIIYQRMAMEDIDTISETFDLVTSSLVFDYAEDFPGLMQKIHHLMKKDAVFVFSMSHPIVTAWDGAYDRIPALKQENVCMPICGITARKGFGRLTGSSMGMSAIIGQFPA